MRIAVFGATGGSGRLLTAHVSAAGHQVVAVVRDAARVTARDVTVVHADVMDLTTFATAIRGCDAVVSLLGPGPVRGLTDGPATGTYRTALGRNVRCGLRLSRADLTDLLLRCAVSAPGQVVAAAY